MYRLGFISKFYEGASLCMVYEWNVMMPFPTFDLLATKISQQEYCCSELVHNLLNKLDVVCIMRVIYEK